ncbi:MAG TPA: phytanoyl-CoA dioxygenase family protein [Bradyrhizobium sp.]|jgi:ectoine hydroxylase-related dioxygenase (phytanoyl-CoA dioxygenase family)|nr:phytanoyl-CoA dioxygenase family protein [Bradyrhizobium sp.]
MTGNVPRYGVHTQIHSETAVDQAVEAIRLVGFAVVNGGYSADELQKFASAFDRTIASTQARYGGRDALAKIDEHNTIRAPLASDRLFLDLALNANVLAICRRMVGGYVILNQQNGIVNPPNAQHYNQAAFHRDLPYQHFVSSRPLAINALFCLDPFTMDNGATRVVPASHKDEAFPSDATVNALQVAVTAEAGCFIMLDAMLFHSGGVNRTGTARRAVNHLYSIPLIRQQIDLPGFLGADYVSDPDTRRLLGYEVRTPPDVAAFYAAQSAKKSGK